MLLNPYRFGSSSVIATDPSFIDVLLLVHFDDSFVDVSRMYYPPIVSGALSITDGKFETAARFDGTGQHISYAGSSSSMVLNADFTIECYVRFTQLSDQVGIICKRMNYTSGGWGVRGGILSSGNTSLTFVYSTRSGTYTIPAYVTAGPHLSLNQWYHIAITRSGSTYRWFVNGVCTNTVVDGSTILVTYDEPVFVGGDVSGWGPTSSFVGDIDELRISKVCLYQSNFIRADVPFPDWNEASPSYSLSDVSLLLSMNGVDGSSSIIDTGSNRQTMLNSGIRSSTTWKKFGTASGHATTTTSYLNTPAHTGFDLNLGPYTLEFWLNITQNPTSDQYFMATGGGQYMAVSTAGTVTIQGYGGSYSFTPAKNVPTHIAITSTGSIMRIFIDGISRNAGTIISMASTVLGIFSIPKRSDLQSLTCGYIDQVIMTRSVRYSNNFDPPSAELISTISDPLWSYVHLRLTGEDATIVDSSSYSTSFSLADTAPVVSTDTSKYGSKSIKFTGGSIDIVGNNYVVPENSPYTVEFWVKPTQLTQTYHTMIDTRDSSHANGLLIWGDAAGYVRVWSHRETSDLMSSAGALVVGTWTHVAVSVSSGIMYLFINGTLAASRPIQNMWFQRLRIGQTQENGNYFYGYLDDLRITKGASRYTSSFTPIETIAG